MKKIVILMMVILFAGLFQFLGASAEEKNDVLVIYFSRTGEQYQVGVIDKGNTAIVAEMIAEKTGADLFEIIPETDYPYTYNELLDVAKKEQREKARPAIKGDLPDLSQYKTIFIGAPVWWNDWPMIMYTFFENNVEELAGKSLVPFSTHGGAGLSGFDKKLQSVCKDSQILTGLEESPHRHLTHCSPRLRLAASFRSDPARLPCFSFWAEKPGRRWPWCVQKKGAQECRLPFSLQTK